MTLTWEILTTILNNSFPSNTVVASDISLMPYLNEAFPP